MAIEKYTVSAVDMREGWVTFAHPADPSDTFRRTLEVHLIVHSRRPQIGEMFDFRVEVNDGQKRHFYVEDHLRKTSAG